MDEKYIEISNLKYDYTKLMIEEVEDIYQNAEKSQKQVVLNLENRNVFCSLINSLKAFFSTLDNQYTLESFSSKKLNISYHTIRRLCLAKTSPNFRQETILKLIDKFYELLEELKPNNNSNQQLEVAY